jgi:hypothetical protein
MRTCSWRLLVAIALMSGCDDDGEGFIEPLPESIEITVAEDGSELISFRGVADNGVMGNSFMLNGYRWNGYRWNGYRWNGYLWNGYLWNGVAVTDVHYDAASGTLQASDAESNTVTLSTGDQLVASGNYDGDTTFVSETKISEIEEVAIAGQSFQFQRVQARVLESTNPEVWGPWQDACTDGADNPAKAILLKGDWASPTYSRVTGTDAEQRTTWACRGAALAKCVEWGYHPEASHAGALLADHHQACTRMVRADYCGNGEHHTENGTPIDVGDSLGIQRHESEWPIEAAWGPNGALCLNDPRKTYWSRSEAVAACGSTPSCDANGNGDPGDDVAYWFGHGALFVTRNQPTDLVVSPPAAPDSGG